MARSFSINYTPPNNDAFWYELKRVCKLAGFTVPRSSDGSTYNSTGDQITTSTSGAGGIANNNAWYVLADPAGHQWCIQRGTGATTCRVKFSHSAGFTGGTPGATQVPSATDEMVLFGTGTDAAPTYAAILSASLMRFHFMADSSSPYGWFAIGYVFAARPFVVLGFDPCTGCNAADPRPYVLYCGGNAATILDTASLTNSYTNSPVTTTLKNGGVETQIKVCVDGYRLASANPVNTVPDNLNINHEDQKDTTRPCSYARNSSQTAPQGDKGVSTLFRTPGTGGRAHTDVYNVATNTAKDYVRMGDLLVPWDGATIPGQ